MSVSRETVRRLCRKLEAEPVSEEERELCERIAAAALLVECARVDTRVEEEERRAVAEAVRSLFDVDDDVVEMLVAVAEQRVEEVWHDWLFTEAIRRGFDAAGRLALLERLWRVALADRALDAKESLLIERIGRELGISREDVQRCRERAG
jgi:uncharacterized tellurite resistance protein B-like protein